MSKNYEIWDRRSDVFTPGTDRSLTGLTYSTPFGTNRFTAAEWLMLHPAPDNAVILCATGDFNGGFFGTLDQIVSMYESHGADFSGATTPEAKLAVIDAFDDAQNAPSDENTPEERIAAALELANVINMPTVNDDDPDAE